ncbi:metallophosphoesterase [Thermoproteota archaeon]
MSRAIQFAIFFTIFILIYASLNSYLVIRLGGLLGLHKNTIISLIAVVTLAMPFTIILERFFQNIITRILYAIASLWMGIGLFLLCTLLVYEIIRPFYQIPYAGIIILSIVGLLSVFSIINAMFLHVEEVEVPIQGLKKEMKVVQLSDIHVGTIRNSAFLQKIAEKTNELEPDIVMITGDLVDGTAALHESMFSGFDKCKAPVFFVSGNHETYEGLGKVYKLLNETKIRPLKNEVVVFDGIQVVGIEFSEDRANTQKQLSRLKINKSKPAVLMFHGPWGMEDAKNHGIDLQLSGHTHNGQIYPFHFFVWLVLKHLRGLYDYDGMYLHVSPGTGTWGPYMRLGSMNEITVLNLVPG